ncbi:MAG: redox-regulated ATPase YchF [Aquificaceae bacterium]|nr:redox-regulated ATPase YchF [Aquificaceae bacterium]MDW8236845.1 redox-regulated ATPase YchF [Aquificaceae bacterium]
MSLSVGIVGLPNVGKSTLFNALIQSAKAAAANYPFCTIEPNSGTVEVPDERLYELAKLERSRKVVPAFVEFVDIAGLVRGANKGEGLGNQFLAHIREVDAIAMVLRCFENQQIVHVEGKVDPIQDAQIIDLELIAKDLETLQKRKEKAQKTAKLGDKLSKLELEIIQRLETYLEKMVPLRAVIRELSEEEINFAKRAVFLLSIKPILFVANVDEKALESGNEHSQRVFEYARSQGAPAVSVCAKLEEELIGLEKSEREQILSAYGLEKPGLDRLIREAFNLLGLVSFFTAGEKETRAWTIVSGTKAPQAAGKIHSDFERGFIAAEVINFQELIKAGGIAKAKELGLLRLEGRDYVIKDGDVVHFRFNV